MYAPVYWKRSSCRRQNKYKSALKAYKRIEKQDADFISEVIEPMISCYRQMDQIDEAQQVFKKSCWISTVAEAAC